MDNHTDNLGNTFLIFIRFYARIIIGTFHSYITLLGKLNGDFKEIMLYVYSFKEIPKIELLSVIITISPGTIVFEKAPNYLRIHCLSYSKEELINLIKDYCSLHSISGQNIVVVEDHALIDQGL